MWGQTTPSVKSVQKLREAFLMFAAMTPGSNHTLAISRKGIERNCCAPHRQKICHFSGSKTKDQRNTKSQKSPGLRTCLAFCFKDRARMDQREQSVDSHGEGTEGRLKELASKWFIDTQVQLIVHNGFFPTWFMGFVTRKDAEEILREKELGCFLIRLSDKTIGYILSYRGRDRCRHFVISQIESGQFVVCGDTMEHDTVSDLIEYYKMSPIQPFAEYLTSPCIEVLNEELYDIIQVSPKEKPVATVRTVSTNAVNMQKALGDLPSEQPPTRPPKCNRTQEEVPPLPRRSRHLDSGPMNDKNKVLYAQLRKQSPREIPRRLCQDNSPGDNLGRADRSTTQDQYIRRCSPPAAPHSVYSELGHLDSKSRSLPLLDNSSDGEQSYRLGAPPHTPPRLSPKPLRQTTHSGLQPENTDLCSTRKSSHSLDYMDNGGIYHLAGRSGSPHTTLSETRSEQHNDSLYTEVPSEAFTGRFTPVSTYELIPSHGDTKPKPNNNNTYEPLEDIRPKHNSSPFGLKNDKWKWLFPEAKRKW